MRLINEAILLINQLGVDETKCVNGRRRRPLLLRVFTIGSKSRARNSTQRGCRRNKHHIERGSDEVNWKVRRATGKPHAEGRIVAGGQGSAAPEFRESRAPATAPVGKLSPSFSLSPSYSSDFQPFSAPLVRHCAFSGGDSLGSGGCRLSATLPFRHLCTTFSPPPEMPALSELLLKLGKRGDLKQSLDCVFNSIWYEHACCYLDRLVLG
ncbi:hypothetical protein LXL04_000880 [Taraxacum kok-saghyz]